ncbi:hypothetical protein M408DRAFT_271989 [Serendipita vermifera MAFF 305830]|uniref:Uncharacterized protein n=1 Tax=Serendipita vermifera MAFF 305830 TaxID=933852 RepID=A0A0C3B220_SERVB|nr:hypothetical protein M408DRAFT_271989 [Serendipita vermifera MAFF 305830]
MMPLTESTEEIEHWCPVCDRLITPTCTLVSGPAPSSTINENTAAPSSTPTSPVTTTSERPTTPTTPVHKRKAALRGGNNTSRPNLYRSRTSMHTIASGHKKRLGANTTATATGGASDHSNRSNPNFVQEFALSTQGHGGGGATAATTAPRTKTSPMGNTSHSDNAKITDGQPGPGLGANERTDRHPDSHSRESGPSAGAIKRKASAPDVNAGPRLKPLTKTRIGAKSRPKSLILTTAQLFETSSKSTKNLDQSGATTPSEPPTAVDPQTPASTSTGPQDTVEELRRRLYCSEECYNIDLKGDNAHPPPSLHDTSTITTPASPTSPKKPFEVKNMSCEMPWLWTNAALPRRMAPTRNPSWVDSGEESEYGAGASRRRSFASEQEPTWLTISQKRSTAPHRKPVPERRQSLPVESQEANALRKAAAAAPSLAGARRATFMAPIESPEDSNSSSNEFYRTSGVTGASTLRGDEHRLFFRRMPGKLDAAPVTKPALFVVDGQWTETPPPGFDYAGFLAAREKERRRRQVEITEAMLLKKKVEDVGPVDEVSRRHHETSRRKKHVHAERVQYERRHSNVHDYGHYDEPLSAKQRQPWWHVDEREDWKTYWAAREDGLENTTFEQWQLQRHAERVQRAEKEQALKRFESEKLRVQKEIASRSTGDGKKVAKRPLLIRVASQPTVSDVDLVGKLYEQTQKSVQQAQERKAALARNNSSSSETSPLGMSRPKPLPPFKSSVESTGEIKRTASPSSFMRGQTLCIPGFVVAEGQSETAPSEKVVSPTSPTASGFVFPLVTVPGSVETRPMELAGPVQAAPEAEHRGRPSSVTGSRAASSVSGSSSKQAEPQSGSHQRTLVPFVSHTKVAASLSPVRRLNSEQVLKLALQGLPTKVVSGSPEVVTAVSGTGSGSGSSGEESSWSSGEKPTDRPGTVKATSTMKRPRTARGLVQTQARPKSMGPLGCPEPANLRMSKATDASHKPEVSSPQSYASLLRYYSEFRGGSTPPGNKPNTSPITDGIEPESRLGKRRSLWGIFGSAKP